MPYDKSSNKKRYSSHCKKITLGKTTISEELWEELSRLIAFENSMASTAQSEDVSRAFHIYDQKRQKAINSQLTPDFFN
ncbi:MAG: hypothetical protein ABII88_03610 [Candidatus Omnitrophota bacterium]